MDGTPVYVNAMITSRFVKALSSKYVNFVTNG